MTDHLELIESEIAKHNSKEKIIVGIDGYAGIGKTTRVQELVKRNPHILPVSRDDFIIPRQQFEALLSKASDKSVVFETEIVDLTKIRKLISAFRSGDTTHRTTIYNSKTGKCDIDKTYDLSKKIMIIEGIFLFHPRQLKEEFDFRIFLDGDMDAADKRRIKREKEKWGNDYFPHDHPDSYFRLVRIAFERYLRIHKPKESANLIL
jgi:uridine kinase